MRKGKFVFWSWWHMTHGPLNGIKPFHHDRWSLALKTAPWGKFGRDWFTDAQRVFDFGFFVVFDHGNK